MEVVSGTVVHGKAVGRGLGFPTANLPLEKRECPDGVYIAEVTLPDQDGLTVPAILNQGEHPTVRGGAATIEIHLLDFAGDLYGRRVTVRYLKYLRPERAFSSPEALSAQIARDVGAARAWFEGRK